MRQSAGGFSVKKENEKTENPDLIYRRDVENTEKGSGGLWVGQDARPTGVMGLLCACRPSGAWRFKDLALLYIYRPSGAKEE